MFDYQAGEKQKLTLIMVGFVGLMAGMLFTMLVMPPGPPPAKARAHQRFMDDPDVTGGRGGGRRYGAAPAAVAAAQPQQAQQPYVAMDKGAAQSLIQSWLTPAWDLSAGTARASQEQAMAYMTPDCKQAYQQNIWTPEIAKSIEESGLQSTFQLAGISASDQQADGSVVVFVQGMQVLTVPGKGVKQRQVRMEYMVRQTPEGPRIAGISEGAG